MKYAFTILLLTACVPRAERHARRLEGRYDLGVPGDGWNKVRPGGADRAWHHSELGATIYTDSNCGARFEDGTLSDLAGHLIFGLTNPTTERQEDLNLDGRAALLRVEAGHIDGVPVRIGTLVTKKNACIYDAIYIAPPDLFDEGWDSFRQVVDGFKVHGN